MSEPGNGAQRPKAPKKSKYLSKEEREDQILAGAISLASSRGLNFTTRELAEKLGINQSLLYRHFANKKALVDRIYDEVYLSRWNPEWEDWLQDRTKPLKQRLIEYLIDYSKAIIRKDWIRIFMLSAFDDPVISQRYIGLLQRRIFEVILDEMSVEVGDDLLEAGVDRDLAIEVIWGFHSSFFYLGVRRWIYDLPVPRDIEKLTEVRVTAFLEGAKTILSTDLAS